MKKISRRGFLRQTISGAAALSLGAGLGRDLLALDAVTRDVNHVLLGKSGVVVSRLALGTGTRGWKFRSDQTALGINGFVELAQYVYDKGIYFFDVADIYGSHKYLREALKHIPREKVVIMSKIWTRSNNWLKVETGAWQKTLDRFRKEIGTDYLDIVLIHSQTDANWPEKEKALRDTLSEAKEKGVIRSHGVSCHSLDALKTAAETDWVEIVLARINHTGARMDDKPEKVMPVIKKIHDSGKGVIGMKIFGCGQLVEEAQREASLQYVWGSHNVDAMTIGFENTEQVDDALKRVKRILKST